MKLRTQIEIEPFVRQIEYGEQGLSVGSCFAENIARRLQRLKFSVVSNPFGVMYNPASVAATIERLAERRNFTELDLLRKDDLWCSFWSHGSFASTDEQWVLNQLNRAYTQGVGALFQSDYVILTFGSAWVYELSTSYPMIDDDHIIREGFTPGNVVANCHKFPSGAFRRRRMGIGEIVGRFGRLLESVLSEKRVIITVSPVRHVKDGLAENNLSKAILRVAAEELANRYANVTYFPAYEIVNDDLRDYRFYADDLVHPSEVAIEYIWQLFSEAAIDKESLELAERVGRVVSAAEHRPLNPESEAHAKFKQSMLRSVRRLQEEAPQLSFEEELKIFGKDE